MGAPEKDRFEMTARLLMGMNGRCWSLLAFEALPSLGKPFVSVAWQLEFGGRPREL